MSLTKIQPSGLETTCLWEAPTPIPTDGKSYQWNEESLNWVEITPTGE
jgi:hypothetical protein